MRSLAGMNVRLRRILLGGGIATVVIVAGIATWLSTIDLHRIVALAEHEALQSTGRGLKIRGPVSLKWSLIPTFAVEELSFANAPWGSRPHMLTVKRAEVSLAVLPLLSGRLEIGRIDLDGLEVLLEVNRNGERNWDLQRHEPGGKKPAESTFEVDIANLNVRNGILQYVGAPPARPWGIVLTDLRLQQRGGEGTLDAEIAAGQVPLKLEGSFARSARLLDVKQLRVALGNARLQASTQLPLDRAARAEWVVDLRAEVPDPAALARALGHSAPKLPALSLEGRTVVREGQLAFDIPKLQLGASHGSLRITTPLDGARPSVAGQADLAVLDLREIGEARPSKPVDTHPAGTKADKLFSAEPLPLAALHAADARLALTVRKLVLKDGHAIEGISAQATLVDGRAQIDPLTWTLGGQLLGARIVADARGGPGMAVDISVQGKGIPLAAIHSLVGIVNRPPEGAPTDIGLTFKGRGTSLRTLMASAQGELRVVIGAGYLPPDSFKLGTGLGALASALTPKGGKPGTELQCAVFRVPYRDGIARIDNGIAAETSQARFIGGGTVNLQEETLDIGVRPRFGSGAGVDFSSLASMVRVGGTLAAPVVRLDAAAAAGNLAEIGLALSTGGLSLPATRYFADRTPEHPCEVALGHAGAAHAKPARASAAPAEPGADPLHRLRRLLGR